MTGSKAKNTSPFCLSHSSVCLHHHVELSKQSIYMNRELKSSACWTTTPDVAAVFPSEPIEQCVSACALGLRAVECSHCHENVRRWINNKIVFFGDGKPVCWSMLYCSIQTHYHIVDALIGIINSFDCQILARGAYCLFTEWKKRGKRR